jgi:hypothetical protein
MFFVRAFLVAHLADLTRTAAVSCCACFLSPQLRLKLEEKGATPEEHHQKHE